MQTGIVHVNDQDIADGAFGGIKNTGYDRFGGLVRVEAFSVTW